MTSVLWIEWKKWMPCAILRDVSMLSRNVRNSLRDVSMLLRDESNLSCDVTHFLHNVVITNFETNGLPYASATVWKLEWNDVVRASSTCLAACRRNNPQREISFMCCWVRLEPLAFMACLITLHINGENFRHDSTIILFTYLYCFLVV